jgi:hypothetical protein
MRFRLIIAALLALVAVAGIAGVYVRSAQAECTDENCN